MHSSSIGEKGRERLIHLSFFLIYPTSMERGIEEEKEVQTAFLRKEILLQ